MAYLKLTEKDKTFLVAWHKGLDQNRGDRAVLRRASSFDDILLLPAFMRFIHQMPSEWLALKDYQLVDAAMVAALVARVTDNKDEKHTFARSLATPAKEGGSKPAMSELRFQQLQKSRTPEDFFRRVQRAVDLLGGKVNICSLAEDVLLWMKEQRYGPASKPQDRLAIRWATDYYKFLRD